VTVTGASEGSATLTATVDGVSASVTLTLRRVALDTVAGGGQTRCGLSSAGEAFCWGRADVGQLGVGFYPSLTAVQPTPLLAQPGLAFSSLSVGAGHTCGLSASGAAYCWGAALFGQLGSGALPEPCNPKDALNSCSVDALPVSGGVTFTALSVGGGHTCGLAAGGVAYCWGANHQGQLGHPSAQSCSGYPCSLDPAPVTGGLAFTTIAAGGVHTCGLTTAGATYCWGSNADGQLGNPAAGQGSEAPIQVSGGFTFTRLSAGPAHTCALTAGGAAYCWGSNFHGEVGSGSAVVSTPSPLPVFGGFIFSTVTAGSTINGYGATCGVTSLGARCWGSGAGGTLGNGSTEDSNIPALVAGSLGFAAIAPSCGIIAAGRVYCWGSGPSVGSGSADAETAVPVEVIGQP